MSFGIITRAADGSENFRAEGQTLRVIHHQVIQSSFTGDVQVSGVTPANAIAYCIPRNPNPYDRGLLTVMGDGFVRLSRYNNSYPPKTNLDLIVLAIL